MKQFDFLVIGGGIAGLTFALEVAERGSVAVLFKRKVEESNTRWAQGGIAAVSDQDDNFSLHIRDTEVAGAGICDHKIVEIVVTEGPDRVRELIERGARFDRKENDSGSGSYDLTREGGHSKRRIFHAADATGWEILRALLDRAKEHKNIHFFTDCNAIDLITTHKLGVAKDEANTVLGAYVLEPTSAVVPYTAKVTMVATGGAGKIYLYTSNPDIASGDGIAMCYRAGVPVANLEFFQFHPTCLYHPEAKSFLITEAMRGEGAKLKRINGEPFMQKYHELQELAPRDIVARAIDNEMKIHGEEHVLLDITHKPADFIKAHFPNIHARCLELGIDITKQPIPVVPAAHYCCGGVLTDDHAGTTIRNLYVAGETAYSGLHGANRLASNSLLEAIVFAHRAADRVKATPDLHAPSCKIPAWNVGSAVDSSEEVIVLQNWDEIRRFMWNYVGIVRSDKRLKRALARSEMIEQEIKDYYWNFTVTSDLLELRNLSLVANLVIRSAIARKESRGLHYNIDYPNTDEAFLKPTVIE